MRNFFRKLHLWLSVPFGIVITITCFTGALLVFETEITDLCYRPLTSVEPVGNPIPVDMLVEKVEPLLEDGVEVTGVVIPSDPTMAYKVNISKPSRSALYVDQYTGEVKGRYGRLSFFDVTRRLHRWLMDTRPKDGGVYWGKTIVGVSTLAFVVILLSGLVIWWPLNRKMFNNRVRVVLNKGRNRFLHDIHVAGGFYVLLLLLAMTLTGLTWSFEWYKEGFYSVLGVEMAQDTDKETALKDGREKKHVVDVAPIAVDSITVENYGEATLLADAVSSATVKTDAVTSATLQMDVVSSATTKADAVSSATVKTDALSSATIKAEAVTSATLQADVMTGATMLAGNVEPQYVWQAALDAVAEMNPDYETITISDGMVTVAQKGFGNKRAYDKFVFNEDTGEIVSEELYGDSPYSSKVAGWVRTVHVGSWGGVVSKVLYFLAALLGSILPITGYYFWIRRLYVKHKKGTKE